MPEKASPQPAAHITPDYDPLQALIELFKDATTASEAAVSVENLTLEDRLQRHIIDGNKQGLVECLEEARETYSPLEIINDHLLAGMKVVGELFGSGKMQLPFVLQSAEVMKMAVAHLEQFMERVEGQTKGSIVLATVKGDVHDIGKNLVDIILTNNGYTVYNIGIKQPLSAILEKWRETGAQAIGMSGLLVKSVNVMEENLRELNEQGVDVPIVLGGAALTRHYAESHLRSVYEGPLLYGKDAFEGLSVMDHIAEDRLADIEVEVKARLAKRSEAEKTIADAKAKRGDREDAALAAARDGDTTTIVRSSAATDIAVPKAPFFGSRVVEDIALDAIYPYINTVALFRGQWQFKKGAMGDAEYQAVLDDKVHPVLDRLKAQCKDEQVLTPRVVYGYFPCNGDGNDVVIYDADDHDKEIERFTFPRQQGRKNQCIADFFRDVGTGERDVIAMTCVTVGTRVSEVAQKLFEANDYTEYLYLHGFGVECAEALAELWHKHVRQEMGIGTEDSPQIRNLFTQKYRGSRYSFGYPACPDMSDQERLFRLIEPERIGCHLTENWQIDPEQSTSAIIVHHPEAKYFNV